MRDKAGDALAADHAHPQVRAEHPGVVVEDRLLHLHRQFAALGGIERVLHLGSVFLKLVAVVMTIVR